MWLRDLRNKKVGIISLGISGMLLVLAGLLLMTFEVAPVHAQLPADADYIGARECQSCHRGVGSSHDETRHAMTLREPRGDAVLANFDQDEEIRQVQFPGEDAPRPFTGDDIGFVVGSARYVQRYLYEVDRNEYMVFPAEWNVVEQRWQAYTLADNWPDVAYDWNQNCAGCHTTGLDPDRGRWEDDAVQCESCHGPGSVHAEIADDADNDLNDETLVEIRAAIIANPDPQICGQCHSQGTGSDNRAYPVGYRPGDDLLLTLNLATPDDSAHWRASGHASGQNMQYNEWLLSGHASALASLRSSDQANDTCLECHSSDYLWTDQLRAANEAGERKGSAPEAVTLETAQYGVTCASCHELHGEGEYDYQLVNEPYALCVSCHADERLEGIHHPVKEMFEGEVLVDPVAGVPSKHFEEGVQCSTCHMPLILQTGTTWHSGSHTMSPLLPGEVTGEQPDSCTGCHTDLSRDYMQQFIDETQTGILDRLTNAQVAIGSRDNIDDWVLAALNFVSNDGSLGIHNYSYTSALLDMVDVQLGIIQPAVPPGIPVRAIEDPTDCAECHSDEYQSWHSSPHANASLSQTFQVQYAEKGRPSYCMSCHASGYDPRTQEYVFEGVTCSSCHYETGNSEHPPGPVEVATDSAVCGQCHSGEHAPTYDEWLVSSHNTAGIDCADCHTAHNNGLVLADVNATCSSCHAEAMTDEIHMGEDMTCADCHMTKRITEDGIHVIQTGHAMTIDPGVCANCHGNIHLMSFGETRLSDQEQSELAALREQVTATRTSAEDNLNTGIVGGAIGALVLAVIVFLVIRLGRLR
jgi:predicted CXXCH cytochrome family protein